MTSTAAGRIISGALFRERKRRVVLRATPPPPSPPEARRPARVATMLALAHHIQSAIDRGVSPDQATVARTLGFTRARVTQLLDLLMLAPDLQHAVLSFEAVDGVEPVAERRLRAIAHRPAWEEQREAWAVVIPTQPPHRLADG